jgi:hypothetical protein
MEQISVWQEVFLCVIFADVLPNCCYCYNNNTNTNNNNNNNNNNNAIKFFLYLLLYLFIYLSIYLSTVLQLLWTLAIFQFLNLYTIGRTPWAGDQPVARPLPTHGIAQTQNKRTQTSIP